MIKFTTLDFRLMQLPEHNRECYLYTKEGKTYVTFSTEYIQQIAEQCDTIKLRRLQANNNLYVPFSHKKLVSTTYKTFELLKPTKR